MGSAQNINGGGVGWLLDYGICDEVLTSDFIWGSQIIDDPMISSAMLGFDASFKEGSGQVNACSKKRSCAESCATPGTKACREKLRRDKLNDRFMELCSTLDPGRPPKADKVAILGDVTRRLNQLRLEAQKLEESNEALQDAIKNLKEEKFELRDEKMKLKAEKVRMEQVLKASRAAPTFIPYKTVPYTNYLPFGMWQWVPSATLDTSKDHVLRPPVA